MARETQGSPADERKLEQYGVWVKVKPRDVTAPVLDESFELSDLQSPQSAVGPSAAARATTFAAAAEGEDMLTEEEEQLLDELETELEPDMPSQGPASAQGRASAAVSVPEEEPILADVELAQIEEPSRRGSSDLELVDVTEEELPELDEEIVTAASARAEPSEVEVTLSDVAAKEESFDDLAALETELASVTQKTRRAGGSTPATASSEILARIEEELKSIRSDLNQLRSDLSGLRKSAADSDGKGQAAEQGIKGGFLDEDEDETIALTGDELDNILNTAEITEEAAEATAASPEADFLAEVPSDASEEILDYESPLPEPVETPTLDTEAVPTVGMETGLSDETLVLSDDDLLPMDGASPVPATMEELPQDLVLEEVSLGEGDETTPSAESLPEVDLEGIPEIEAAPADGLSQALDDESETIDLETLDLGDEPKVIEAVSEQVDDSDLLAGDVTDLDAGGVPNLGGEETLVAEGPSSFGASADMELPEVDLEALAAEAEDLEEVGPSAPLVEDLEVGELEAVADEVPAGTPQQEIEISLEDGLGTEAGTSSSAEIADGILQAEEIEEAEEAAPSGVAHPTTVAAGPGIPDNLKDEIRTVLKYMDHLLEALPDEKIQEFASSDYFVMYKKLFEDLGLGE